jgi:predicted amidophosphoribosyltransferase
MPNGTSRQNNSYKLCGKKNNHTFVASQHDNQQVADVRIYSCYSPLVSLSFQRSKFSGQLFAALSAQALEQYLYKKLPQVVNPAVK